MDQAKTIRLEKGDCIASYDVKALFISVPLDPAISMIKYKLEQDTQLYQRTSMFIHHIIRLIEFCLKNANFLFQGNYFEQVHGSGMGSPISPILANLFMEEHKIKATNTATNSLRILLGYMDDTFVIQKVEHSHQLLQQSTLLTLTYYSLQRHPTQMDPYPLWILKPHLELTTHISQQYTGIPPTQTSTFIGTAAITYLIGIIYSTLLHTGQGLFVPADI